MSRDRGDTETNFEVRSFDACMSLEDYNRLPKHDLYIVLDNLRSAFNVGAIFRLCDTMRVSGLYLCGYTAHPPHHKLQRTSLGTVDYVPWRHYARARDAIDALRAGGVTVWGAETTGRSRPYAAVRWPSPLAIVFGNEALGLSEDVLKMCDELVEIPTYGFKNSLNVATAVAVLGYRALEEMSAGTKK